MNREAIAVNNVSLDYSLPQSSIGKELRRFFIEHEIDSAGKWRALDNITFKVDQGDRFAIIGPNGAGKTSLLKLLSGIYQPTAGSVSINGKVHSILSLGLGLDSELSGRKNILAQALLLGITKSKAKTLESQIIEFADIGKHIDLPFYTYSAGMQARLVFSINTAINPDILIVDEGIGAGDAEFFKKAEERVHELIKDSRAFILATHNEALAKTLCTKALVLNRGKLAYVGDIDEGFEVMAKINREKHSNEIES
jgi:ABC-type polysaccharide/polyol phosphate transport system ATPase subunit